MLNANSARLDIPGSQRLLDTMRCSNLLQAQGEQQQHQNIEDMQWQSTEHLDMTLAAPCKVC
jgi:hypothetical protein